MAGYHSALTFLHDKCGVASRSLLPSVAMVLPLSIVLPRKGRRSFSQELQRWFWRTSILQTYAQGANTQCVRDAKELAAWLENVNSEPETVRRFEGVEIDALMDARRRNEMLLRGLLCGIVATGALDWDGETKLSAVGGLVPHKVMTKQQLQQDDEEGDLVVDYTVLVPATHKVSINREFVKLSDEEWSVLDKHLIPKGPASSGAWQLFRKKRAELARALLDKRNLSTSLRHRCAVV